MISINPSTYVITIPRADLTFLGGSSYQLNTNTFRLQLRDWEDSVDGIYQPKTHNHNTSVLLGGIQYARVLEVLSPYTITLEEVGSPYVVTLTGSNNNILEKTNLGTVQILSNNSAGLINVTEVQYSSFGGGVTINAAVGVAGTTYPIGTAHTPVNNLADAKVIANGKGLKTFYVIGALTIGATEDISGYELVGFGASFTSAATSITLTSGCTTTNTRYENLRIDGRQNGESIYKNCIIGNLTNTHCLYKDCGIIGPLQKTNAAWTATHSADYVNCRGSKDMFILDCNGTLLTQTFHSLSGHIKVINFTYASGKLHIGLTAGEIWLDASCTAGEIVLHGAGKLRNEANGAAVDVASFTEAALTQHASFENKVTINVGNGSSGTAYPIGTHLNPVNNLADALVIAAARGFDRFHLESSLTITTGQNVNGYIFESDTWHVVTVQAGVSLANTNFERVSLYGVMSGSWNILTDCWVYNITNFIGWVKGGSIGSVALGVGDSGAEFGSQVFFDDLVPLHPDVTSTLVMNTNTSASLSHCKDIVTIKSMPASSKVVCGLLAGELIIDSTCTGGTITVSGVGTLKNNSTGVTLDSKNLVEAKLIDNIKHSVETLRPHHTGFGEMIYWDPVLGNDAFDGSAPSLATKTFTAALALATDGAHDVIVALASSAGQTVFDGTITINKSYTFLRGPGRDFKIKPTSTTSPTVLINATGVEISGMIIETANTGGQDAIKIADGADFFYLNNVWSNFASGDTVSIEGTSIVYGRISNCFFAHAGAKGIYINGNIRHTKIINTEVDGAVGDGIVIEGTTARNNIIGPNVAVYACGGYGIKIIAPALRNLITGVSIYDNTSGDILDGGTNTEYENGADSIWDEAIAGHLTAGSTGKALSDAGGAGNPWGSPIEGNTAAGTFGELVGKKLLTVAKFLGLK